MLCYKDMSYCSASYKEAEKPCICTECFRHLSKVPENLPDYMYRFSSCICYRGFKLLCLW